MLKRIRFWLMLTFVLILAGSASAAVRIQNNGNCWFLQDGRIVQSQRVVAQDGPSYPELRCYDPQGSTQWTYRLFTPAIGRSYCQLVDENMLAFLYYNDEREYYIEYINPQGELVHLETLSPNTVEAVLFEQGIVICEREDSGMEMTVRHWDGSRKSWNLHGIQKLVVHPAEIHAGKLCIEAAYLNSQNQTVRSLLCIDAEGKQPWEYRLNSAAWPIVQFVANEMGGITLFVPAEKDGHRFIQMITLDEAGKEIASRRLDGISPVMAWNLAEDQKNGCYQVWGSENDKVVQLSINASGSTVQQMEMEVGYATCISYMGEVYFMVYDNKLEYFELLKSDEFM